MISQQNFFSEKLSVIGSARAKAPALKQLMGYRMPEQKSSYGYEELLTCARGEMFGQGNAQLPAPPMLMFDRITEISETGGENGKGYIRA